jgi:PAS domain S-box-containing protein
MSMRIKLLLPSLALLGAALALMLWHGAPALMPAWLVALALGLVIVQALVHERWVMHGLRALQATLRPAPHSQVAEAAPGREWRDVVELALGLGASAERDRVALEHLGDECHRMEEALRQSEQRYALAVRGANDGRWEWDLASDRLTFSPRWRHMLGMVDSDEAMSVAQWRERLHPHDRDTAASSMRAHLDGLTDHYELAQRVRHADGSYRWVLSRAAAVRRASGKPQRVVGVDTDITQIKRVESIISAIADGTEARWGEAFFQALVMHFARALQIDCAFITECTDQTATRARTLAFWRRGAFDANFEYDLAGTPCEQVIREGRQCFYPSHVGQLFSCEEGEEGYLGLPIFAHDGFIIGHLAFVHGQPMYEDMLLESVYRIFTARAGVEIELGQALRQMTGRQAVPARHPQEGTQGRRAV